MYKFQSPGFPFSGYFKRSFFLENKRIDPPVQQPQQSKQQDPIQYRIAEKHPNPIVEMIHVRPGQADEKQAAYPEDDQAGPNGLHFQRLPDQMKKQDHAQPKAIVEEM